MAITGPQDIDEADIDEAVTATASALREVADRDWSVPAAGLEWSCHDTAVHIASDYTGYATQLTGRATDGYAPFDVVAAPGATPGGLVRVLEATGGLLAAAVHRTPADVRAWHPYGAAGGDGFAAMGVVEALVHTHDILTGLGEHGWEPPRRLCALALDRLFPHVPPGGDPWRSLLWATGRGELPGLARLGAWRWHADPVRSERLALCEVGPGTAADLRDAGSGGFAWAGDGPEEGTRFAAGMVVKAAEAGAYRPGWGTYAVVRRSDGRAVGGIGFHAAPDAGGEAEVGYDIVRSERGRGYASEALRALAGRAFTRPGLRVLRATVEPGNAASRAVLERAGFTPAGATDGGLRYTLVRPPSAG
ncbi:GNAT family N-acetyltransferase [Streptomyces rubrolavendulae]|uniref:Putative ribosomal N-acetyltransferase YdaF n=1 Tax=Streptomyces rubrolavendulae TaxID=285473 RepID=A0A1D8GAW8_9ACTN|nr:GNAT family N-acetyltransferase [Streptomyces rubrolavendulae]AOT62584.1 Putative ribosomal N-acetyltransferase YdaF [Streptomyces rubrolavendulae]